MKCGEPLPAAGIGFDPPVAEVYLACSKCGAKLPEGAEFCLKCGKPVSSRKKAASEPDSGVTLDASQVASRPRRR